ncbi:MAG: hypothetical protein AB7F86_00300 [Bdellovibrionales bacterium]
MARGIAVLLILTWVPMASAKIFVTKGDLTVYSEPKRTSTTLFQLIPGQRISIGKKRYGKFRKIKVRLNGVVRSGFVSLEDITSPTPSKPPKPKKWAGGVGMAYSRLSQGSKSFTTDDQVNYDISEISGQNTNPYGLLQLGYGGFWRFYMGLRNVELKGTAKINVTGSSSQDVLINYKMLQMGVQVAWDLWSERLYAGAGFEVSKSLSGSVKMGSRNLSDAELPTYLGLMGIVGAHLLVADPWALVVEGHAGIISNQTPSLTVMELAVAGLYWF